MKTDSRDAAALCSCLDRYLAGNRGALAVVRVPTEAEEAARAMGRQRQSLARERVHLILQGKSAALLEGGSHAIFSRMCRPIDVGGFGMIEPSLDHFRRDAEGDKNREIRIKRGFAVR